MKYHIHKTHVSKFVFACCAAVLVIAASGAVYRAAAKKLNALSHVKVMPAIPFDQFPMEIDGWAGQDVPITETVLKVAANDDYVNRFYVKKDERLNGSLYVAYTAEPRRMLGHRPRRCYTGNGWQHEGTEDCVIETPSGRKIDALLHRFYMPGMDYQEIVVLNYYIVNGQVTTDHQQFSGLRWRRPKMSDGRLDYVAQVQISSVTEAGAKSLASTLADPIFLHLPAQKQQ